MSEEQGVTIAVQPWMRDHALDGRAILPAVETLLILAARVGEEFPEIPDNRLRHMHGARFARFLEIPGSADTLEVLVSCKPGENGTVRAVLSRRVKLRAMTRLLVHGEVCFASTEPVSDRDTFDPVPAGAQAVSAEDIYSRMVPFGPAYHTLRDKLVLDGDRAWGRLRAPGYGKGRTAQHLLGSPFPLDGAMHAACVLGRQHVDYVPFPVGFDSRTIFRPTRAEEGYTTQVRMRESSREELVFDLWIRDREQRVCEMVRGLRMRDVLKRSMGKATGIPVPVQGSG